MNSIIKSVSIYAYAIFSDFLYKTICFGYSYELHRQVDAIQMGTQNNMPL